MQLADLLEFLFTEVSLKIKKGLELISRPHFSQNFLIKFFAIILHKLAKFNYWTVFTLFKLFSKMCLMFHAWASDDVITFEYLKSYFKNEKCF